MVFYGKISEKRLEKPNHFIFASFCDRLLCGGREFPDFEPEMLKAGGILEPHLSPVAGITERITEGNTRQIYQALDGQALGLYDSEEK